MQSGGFCVFSNTKPRAKVNPDAARSSSLVRVRVVQQRETAEKFFISFSIHTEKDIVFLLAMVVVDFWFGFPFAFDSERVVFGFIFQINENRMFFH